MSSFQTAIDIARSIGFVTQV